jgi:hypothetical protein
MRNTFTYSLTMLLGVAILASGCSMSGPRVDEIHSTAPRYSHEVTVPEGTSMVVALDKELRTDTHRSGDAFTAHTTAPVMVGRTMVFPTGSVVHGHLSGVVDARRSSGPAQMTLIFDNIIDPSGYEHSLPTELITLVAKPNPGGDAQKVAGGAVLGGIIGALTTKDKLKGAVIGGAAGAVVGGAIAIATKDNNLEIPRNQRFQLALTRPIDVPYAHLD